MEGRRAAVSARMFAALVVSACGSLLPSSGDDADDEGGDAGASVETRGADASFDGPTTVPVDPSVDDPPEPKDAASGADGGTAGTTDAGKDATTTTPSDGTWGCETTTVGPFTSLTTCEAARNVSCDPPDPDVVDGKTCTKPRDTHAACGACSTKNSFNRRLCICR